MKTPLVGCANLNMIKVLHMSKLMIIFNWTCPQVIYCGSKCDFKTYSSLVTRMSNNECGTLNKK